jgi:serine/threonine-protein kinase RsbW
MQTVAEQLDLELPAEPESVTRARHAAVELARTAGVEASDVEIAVSEAVGNAVLHAYPEDGDHERETVRLTGTVHDRRLVFVVQDHGVGMRPNPDSPGLRLGLPLIGQVSDDMHIDTHFGGTRVSMAFPAGRG